MWTIILDLLKVSIGVLLGALAVYFSTVAHEKRNRRLETQALAAMLSAEIESILLHAKRRNYEEYYKQHLDSFKSRELSSYPSIRGLNENLPEIIAISIDRLGLLGPDLCRELISWYSSLQGIKIDLIELSSGNVHHYEREELIKQNLKIWNSEVKGKAPELIHRLKNI